MDAYHGHSVHLQPHIFADDDDEYDEPVKPSSKALGKRKVVDAETSDGMFFSQTFFLSNF